MTRQTALLTAALCGLAVSGAGCVSGWEQARFKREIDVTLRLPPGLGLDARTANGSVTIVEAARHDVRVLAQVRATSQERADAVQIVGDTSTGWLVVTAAWPEDGRRSSEGVSFEIEAPGDRPIRADTGNGAISITGFAGGVVAETSNGAVTITGHDGPIEADTSNGAVTISGATSTVDADTSNGSVRIELADSATGPVHVDTSNGSVTLVVGPGFAGEIVAGTSNGSVSASGAGVRSATGSKSRKTVQIGEGDAQSRIDSSNGSVTIQTRAQPRAQTRAQPGG